MQVVDVQNLIHAHYKGESDFYQAVEKLANKEFIAGRESIATKIRKTLECYGTKRGGYTVKPLQPRTPQNEKNQSMFEVRKSNITLLDLIAPQQVINDLKQIVFEYNHREEFQKYGLKITNTILFNGTPGVGKTWGATALAGELGLDIVYARWDSIVSSYLGSTGSNIRKVFEAAEGQPVILFLDEFDAVGKERGDKQEVGELSRVVINLLQNIDMLSENSILIAATNHGTLLDSAMWRRFKTIDIPRPEQEERARLISYYSKGLPININTSDWVKETAGLTGADIKEKLHSEAKRIIMEQLRKQENAV